MTVRNLIPTAYKNLDKVYALCKRYVFEGRERYVVTVCNTLDSAISCGVDSIAGFHNYCDARIMAINMDALEGIYDLQDEKIVDYGECVGKISRTGNEITVWRVIE